jgi:hypothetical protein
VAANTPVLVIAANLTEGERGIGSINLLHVVDPIEGDFLEWSGVNSTTGASSTPTLTGGYTDNAGSTMLTFDFESQVSLQTFDADHFVVHNAASFQETGTVWILPAPTPPGWLETPVPGSRRCPLTARETDIGIRLHRVPNAG